MTTSKIPIGFCELDGDKILLSYKKYISGGKNIKTETIQEKYDKGKYDSPYKLYHDIKIASSAKIESLKLGSEDYKAIDFFYRFTSELLLQEVARLHLLFSKNDNKPSDLMSDLFIQLCDDFHKISYSYTASNDEMVTYISKTEEPEPQTISPYSNIYPNQSPVPTRTIKQPLFSSLIGKSSLDTNPTFVPDPYMVSNVIPVNKNQARNSTNLSTISSASSKIPTPLDQLPSALLQDFFHPIWYTIPVPTWLNYKSSILKPATLANNAYTTPSALSLQSNNQGEKPKLLVLQQKNSDANDSNTFIEVPGDCVRSFAPNVDLTETIVTDSFKSRIWLQHLGFEQIESIKKKYLQGLQSNLEPSQTIKPVEIEETSEPKKDATPIESKHITPSPEELKIDTSKEADISDINGSVEIDVSNLMEWDPIKIQALDELIQEKKSTFESPQSLQRMISTSLIKLNRLRQERYLKSDQKLIAPPSDDEVKLYNKLSKLIEITIKLYKINPGDFSIEFSKKIPVLVSEFCGSLPAVAPTKAPTQYNSTSQYSTSTRLPTIRGPYKKKNRI